MNTTNRVPSPTANKRLYFQPVVKKLGHVAKLTLKMGSNTDMQGGHI